MRHRIAVGGSLAVALLVGSALAAEALKSGPQAGDQLTPFEPRHVTGPDVNTKRCLV